MKKERRKKRISYLAVMGCMMVSLAACGASVNGIGGSSAGTSSFAQTDTQPTESIQEGGEYLHFMMELSVVESEQSEESEISLSQVLTNIIIENTTMETLEESENYFVVKITYPDAGTLMMEKMSQYEDADLETHMDDIFNEVINAVSRGECMTEAELTVEYVTDEFGSGTVVMTPELANAMSGGFYSYVENGQQSK